MSEPVTSSNRLHRTAQSPTWGHLRAALFLWLCAPSQLEGCCTGKHLLYLLGKREHCHSVMTTSATTPTLSTGATPNPTNQGTTVSGRPANVSDDAQKDWISTHWRWVVMLIILVLGLGGLAVGGVYLRRYIHRRRDAQEAALAGPRQDLQTWGPGQSVHEFDSPVAVANNAGREKGRDIEMVQTSEGTNDRRNSGRLKKFLPGRG
ncbi:MAG: hypothetical protein Q9178_005800 [Gyalolechia marmorata]